MSQLLLCLLLASACSALQLRDTFFSQGDVVEVAPPDVPGSAGPARLFIGSAPDGFDRVGGRPVVQHGYSHRLLGRIDLTLGGGACDPGDANHLSRESVFERLRARARAQGGDAVIYVQTHAQDAWMSDCARVDEVGGQVREEPWARGWVVVLEQEQAPDEAAASSADAGTLSREDRLGDLPRDAGSGLAVDAGLGDPETVPLPPPP